ncbi:MAG: solute-binding protein, partial [Clostridiales bacterium]|nr:solute-binding protein [Clostridiales bacterium]
GTFWNSDFPPQKVIEICKGVEKSFSSLIKDKRVIWVCHDFESYKELIQQTNRNNILFSKSTTQLSFEAFSLNNDIPITVDNSGTVIFNGVDVDTLLDSDIKEDAVFIDIGLGMQFNANNVDESSVVDLLKNQVVLIASKNSETAVTGFENIPDASNFALAADSVPVGQYSRKIFETLGITNQVLEMEINECDNVSAVKKAVAEGSNEIGTVYYSDYYSVVNDVNLIAVADESWCSPIVYPVARVINAAATDSQIQETNDFITFLQSDEVKVIFEKYMFIWNQ